MIKTPKRRFNHMRFQVPQFIDVEDKIFGPFSFKQFLYIAGSIGMSFLVLRIVSIKFIAYPIIVVIMSFGLALAFYRVNGMPFIRLVESAVKFVSGSKLYLWRKEYRGKEKKPIEGLIYRELEVPDIGASKLKNLTRDVEITDNSEKKEE
jgi:hypothetical protein